MEKKLYKKYNADGTIDLCFAEDVDEADAIFGCYEDEDKDDDGGI